MDTSSKYVLSLYSNQVIYNLSHLEASLSYTPNGIRIAEDQDDLEKYYWTVFDVPQDRGSCRNLATDPYSIDTSHIYYTSSDGTACYSFGSTYNVVLYDQNNPVRGLTINYDQGSTKWCPFDRPRIFDINTNSRAMQEITNMCTAKVL